MRAGPHPHSLDSNDDGCRHTASSTCTQKLTNRTITAATTIYSALSGQQRRPSFAPQGADDLWGIAHLVTCAFDHSPTSTAPTPTPCSTLHPSSTRSDPYTAPQPSQGHPMRTQRDQRTSGPQRHGHWQVPVHRHPSIRTHPCIPYQQPLHITTTSRTGWAGEREVIKKPSEPTWRAQRTDTLRARESGPWAPRPAKPRSTDSAQVL
ncbi:hypothetical protein BJ912DRAFT_969322, partial [Pholiota molesta]